MGYMVKAAVQSNGWACGMGECVSLRFDVGHCARSRAKVSMTDGRMAMPFLCGVRVQRILCCCAVPENNPKSMLSAE